jgi:dipeptidyl-peptidase-4
MNKIFLLFVSCLLTFSTQAQLKKISLEDAVLQQNRKFGADKLTGFQWIPNSGNYSYYTDSWTKMMSTNVAKSIPHWEQN